MLVSKIVGRPARCRRAITAIRPAAFLAVSLAVLASSACLVLNVNPAYDGDSIGWDPALVGNWHNPDDNASMQIEKSEWSSYKIHYVHPIETGDLTGYLTLVGKERFLDVMPQRGVDRGSLLIPVHAVLRVRLDGDSLELTPLSYDWFYDRVRARLPIPGLAVAMDQKENALIVSPVGRFRDWLSRQPPAAQVFGAPAVFKRKS